ncbi:MAG: Gfo/Idh/MocA family protein [Bacteroidota bacterium]
MKKIRYGIIGFGAFAERAILPAIRLAKNSEIVAIQKRSMDAAKQKAEEYSVPLYYDSVESLVQSNEVDAVFIVSANSSHHSETIAAAKAGKHVLVEKPMAVSLHQAVEMTDACRVSGVKFMTGHMLRFSPLNQRLKELVQSGAIGTVTYARSHFVYNVGLSNRSWVLDKGTAGGGPLFDIGIHSLDTIRFVLNDDHVVDVKSLMNPDNSAENVERTSVLSLRFSQGTLATVYTSYETPYRESFIEFIGTTGSISAYQFTPSNTETFIEIKRGKNGLVDSTERETFRVPNLYTLEVEHFSDCILNGTEPVITVKDSLHNQEILEKAVFLSKK